MGVCLREDKLCSMEKAVSLIKDGAKVAVGGVLTAREPNAIIRRMIKDRKKNIHTIAGAHNFSIDLLCAAQALAVCENSFVGYEFDLGLALNYRRACEQKRVVVKETDCNILLQQLRAAQFGVPFLPMPRLDGSGILDLHEEYKQADCPYTGRPVTLVPALKPDVAIIHAHAADPKGNVKIFGSVFKDKLFAQVAEIVIVSAERIVSEEEMKKLGPTIAYYYTDAIVEASFGAHPSSCYPDYTYDRAHMQLFIKHSKDDETAASYLEKYVRNADNHEYLKLIGGQEKRAFLKGWQDDKKQWMEAFQ